MEPAEKLPLRPCAATLVLNAEGLIWAGKRLANEEYTGEVRLWQCPQGGIDPGEEPEVAARRELFEETAIRSVNLMEAYPGTLDYELPPELVGKALKGKYRGQALHWFVYRFEGVDDEVNIHNPPGGEKPEFGEWRWIELDRMLDLVVPFKVDIYTKLIAHFSGNPAFRFSN